MARPKAIDPKIQRNFYPPESLWARVVEAANADGVKPADLVLAAVELEVIRREQASRKAANVR